MRLLLVLILLATTFAGCTDAEPEPTSSTTTTPSETTSATSTSTTSSSTTAAPTPRTWDLDITDNSFPDGSIEIRAGDTVRWTHKGSNPHTVTADDGAFDSGSGTPVAWMRGGDTFEFTFTVAGSFAYHCEVHGSMTGTITVL